MSNKKKRIIFTSGTFDLINRGHINILERSKALGDILIVGVSTDSLVQSYKKVKPIISYSDRVKIVSSFKYVDRVVKQTELMSIDLLKEYSVDCATIGSDWYNKYLPGLEWMKKHGEVVYLPYTKSISTTVIKRRIIENSYKIIKAELMREK